MSEPWSSILFFGLLLLDYAVWFHAWPFVVKRRNDSRLHPAIPAEREAAVALYGFLATFFALGLICVVLWLVGRVR